MISKKKRNREIEEVAAANYDKTVDLIDEPEAAQYYTTFAMRKTL